MEAYFRTKKRMEQQHLEQLLSAVAAGDLSPSLAARQLAQSTLEDSLSGLTLDTQRAMRTGLGEVVFAQNKSHEALLGAVSGLHQDGSPVLATRVSAEQGELLTGAFPQGRYWPMTRLFLLPQRLPDGSSAAPLELGPPWPQQGDILVVTAGAADIPVAAEAYGALRFWGRNCGLISDVGVAGLHRLAPHLPALRAARCVIAVAGMEGALPSVLAGLLSCPLLAVPTSVGYGVGAGGRAALSTMLCSCVPGVAVVNIDNGFGAAAFAAKMVPPAANDGTSAG